MSETGAASIIDIRAQHRWSSPIAVCAADACDRVHAASTGLCLLIGQDRSPASKQVALFELIADLDNKSWEIETSRQKDNVTVPDGRSVITQQSAAMVRRPVVLGPPRSIERWDEAKNNPWNSIGGSTTVGRSKLSTSLAWVSLSRAPNGIRNDHPPAPR